ncbi:MAG: DUF4062 domain-containing protein [Lachnospira sp.]|nr:DUF4062 domain-containing protein [Lachnospira sp.]
MQKKYQVFVSSTYEDLIEERKEVIQALLESNCIPTGMELFTASNKAQWEIIKHVIDDCDYYLLILAGRYGSLGINDEGRKLGYIEMEFDYALLTGKPIIAFINNDTQNIPEKKSESSELGKELLKNFQNKVEDGRTVKFWTNKDNLKSAVLSSIRTLIEQSPSGGWIRVGDIIDFNSKLEIINSENDYYSGEWKSITEQGFIDIIQLNYNEYSHILSGSIKRHSPERLANRKWHCIGCVVGESILLIYYSHATHSAGCGLVRHYCDEIYKGFYLRYNYGTHTIDKVDMSLEKL